MPSFQSTLSCAVAAILIASQLPYSVFAAELGATPSSTAKRAVPLNAPPAGQDDEAQPFTPITIPATVQAFFVTDLYAKDAGYISQVNNDIGDHVKQGQVLAVIEDPELKAQFDRAQAAVEQAKATLEVAKRQLVGMQADLTLQKVTAKRQKNYLKAKPQRRRRSMRHGPKRTYRAPPRKRAKRRSPWLKLILRPPRPKPSGYGRCFSTIRLWRHSTG